jgi:hypothetical protein
MHAPALARSDDLAGTAAIEKAFERPRRAENTIATRIILRRRSAEVGAALFTDIAVKAKRLYRWVRRGSQFR